MAITHNNIQSNVDATTLSAYLPPSLTDACLVVTITSEDIGNNDPITSVTFGGVAMIEGVISHSVVGGNAQDAAIFYLLNPSVSAGDIVVSGSERQSIVAMTLDNVDQTTPTDGSGVKEISSGTDLSVSSTTANANSFALSVAVGDNTSNVLTLTTATKLISLTPTSGSSAVAVSTQASSGFFTHDWQSSNSLFRAASALMSFNEQGGGGLTLTAGNGSFTTSFQPATLTYTPINSYTITADNGAFTTALTAADLLFNRSISADSASYTTSFQDATLSYTTAGQYTLVANNGNFTTSGNNISLIYDRAIKADNGSYNTTGTELNLLYGRTLTALSGGYVATGQDISFLYNRVIIGSSGDFITTGYNASLIYSGQQTQVIGSVTTSFAQDAYTASYKPNSITVNFKD